MCHFVVRHGEAGTVGHNRAQSRRARIRVEAWCVQTNVRCDQGGGKVTGLMLTCF